jgi:hypothetical protein
VVINLQRRPRIWRRRSLWSARDVKRSRNVRCFLNGVDVTNRCFYYDGRRRIVRLFEHDANGKVYLNEFRDGVVWREYRGHVKLTHKKAAA